MWSRRVGRSAARSRVDVPNILEPRVPNANRRAWSQPAMMTDPIADMLTRIRNANQAVHDKVDIPTSRLKVEVAKILRAEGFIKNFKVLESDTQGILRIYLRYGQGNQRIIIGLRRVSRPGLRVYANSRRLPRVMSGLGVAILSTSQGLMTDRAAKERGVGGEVLCHVW